MEAFAIAQTVLAFMQLGRIALSEGRTILNELFGTLETAQAEGRDLTDEEMEGFRSRRDAAIAEL